MTAIPNRLDVIGRAKQEIETPALLIDADALEANLAAGRDLFGAGVVGYRPHTKSHKSPVIAQRQLEHGATGICCAKPSEAEVMLQAGLTDVLVTTPVVGQRKIERLVSSIGSASLAVVVDDGDNVESLNDAAADAGASLGVLVEVDVGQGRCGVRSGKQAVALARQIDAAEHLVFLGLQGYHGSIQLIPGFEQRLAAVGTALELLLEVSDAITGSGIQVSVLTGGGTGSSMIDVALNGLTEIQPGSYVFMDCQYMQLEWSAGHEIVPFQPSLTVLGTIISRPSDETAILDVGWKAASMDGGVPTIAHLAGATFSFAGDEHGLLTAEAGCQAPPAGTTVELCPSHCDTTVNLYNEYVVVRGGVVEDLWPIEARGKTQ